MRFENKYEYTNLFGSPRHIWSVAGARMAIHLHIMDMGQEYAEKHGEHRYSGGIEIHYRTPPDYMRHDAPSQKKCWLLGGPCWHDGSSLQASEHWIPMWKCAQHDHERMFRMLERELIERDGGYPEEDPK